MALSLLTIPRFFPLHAQEITGTPGSPSATTTIDGRYLPPPPQRFQGEINLNAAQSKPAWPARVVPPQGAPNILLILTDDVGFGAPSTFGGIIPTPTLDRLAKDGLRYTNFHTTSLCSPTRAALITGRNHHSVGFGVISEVATGFPGYNSIIPKDSATIGRILLDNGYRTAWFGKDHNTPTYQSSQAGPFGQWPIGLGFEYFYGFIGGETRAAPSFNAKPLHQRAPVPSHTIRLTFSATSERQRVRPLEELRARLDSHSECKTALCLAHYESRPLVVLRSAYSKRIVQPTNRRSPSGQLGFWSGKRHSDNVVHGTASESPRETPSLMP